MSVAVNSRVHEQGPVKADLNLSAVQVPTIIILSGLLGSGKTSLAETIFHFNQTSAEERAMIFNERNLSLAQSDAARIPDSIRKKTLDGCACCSSNAKLLEAAAQFISDGKKLILIEQSGVTDGGQLRATLESALGMRARIRLLAVVDSEHLDAPPSVLHSSILASDCVIASHVHDPQRLQKAGDFLRELNGQDFDFVQARAGDFNEEIWDRLNRQKTDVSLGGLSVVSFPAGRDSEEYKKERASLLRSTQSVAIVLYPDVSEQMIADSLSAREISEVALIDRAKGFMQDGSDWYSVQYELKDNNQADFCVNKVPNAPNLMEGRPHLFILSTHGTPPAELFLQIGTPDFSEKAVEYYLNLYPSLEEMERLLAQEAGVPVRSDGDALFMSARKLYELMDQIPESRIEEFESAFVTLLDKFISWRIDASDLLAREHRVDKAFDTAERQVDLGYTLSWTIQKFRQVLPITDIFGDLLERTLKIKPASMLFNGFSKIKHFTIDGEEEITPEIVNDIGLFAAQARQHEGMSLDLAERAIANLKLVAADGKNQSLINYLSNIEEVIRGQFS